MLLPACRSRVGRNRSSGFSPPPATDLSCITRALSRCTKPAMSGVRMAWRTPGSIWCGTGSSSCGTYFSAWNRPSPLCGAEFFVCSAPAPACGMADALSGTTLFPCGTLARSCGTMFRLCGWRSGSCSTTLPLCCNRSFACGTEIGNHRSEAAARGLFRYVCGVCGLASTAAAVDCMIARCVASTTDLAFCMGLHSVTTSGIDLSAQRVRMHARRRWYSSLGRVAYARASLIRRRAIPSGLSHRKCPKPGFRSNVFG
jgi:hypothetical protein